AREQTATHCMLGSAQVEDHSPMSADIPTRRGLYNSAYEHDSCGIGFVANIKGVGSHDIVERGLEALERMAHRGAESADNRTGDGAGILMQIPHEFYRELVPTLPEPGHYGTGIVFLPQHPDEMDYCIQDLEKVVCEEKLRVLA